MRLSISRVLRFASLIRSVRNRILNGCARLATGRRLMIDWSDIKVMHPESIVIGDSFSAGRGLWLESVGGKGRLTIGQHVNLSDYVHIGCALSVTIGNGVLIGSKVLVSDHSHGETGTRGLHDMQLPPNQRPIVSKGPVTIADNVWIGDGACILPDVTIGTGAIIGANAVVIRDVPAQTIWAGVPAKQVWPSTSENLKA
jgi:lipopolysaccharide O-acetyltransferase